MDQFRPNFRSYIENIRETKSLVQLRQIRDKFHQDSQTDNHFNHDSLNIFYDEMIMRVVALVEQQMNDEHGLDRTPAAYAFLLFGSGGRREQVLGSDQDNGFIYELNENSDQAKQMLIHEFFKRFAQQLNDSLLQLGFAECSGRVLAGESRWRKSQTEWRQQLTTWMDDPTFEFVRNLLVFVDARCIAGDRQLLIDLRKQIFDRARTDSQLVRAMLRNTMHRKVLIGIFGQIITEPFGEAQGGIDVKYGAYVPFVNAVRMLAIYHGIPSSSTIRRLHLLAEVNHISEQQLAEWMHAFSTIMALRANTYLQEGTELYSSEGKLKASQLSKEMISPLKTAMRSAKDLQLYTRKYIESHTGGATSWI